MKRALLLSLCCLLCGAVATSQAAPIAFYNDAAFVDTSREAPNLAAGLTGNGHTVSPFTGTSAAAFSSALSGASVLVIPELERGNLFAALTPGARTAITDYVAAGGGLIIAGDGPLNAVQFLNGLFGYSLTQNTFTAGGSTALDAAEAVGTPFAGGPPTLPNANGTALLDTSSLPGGALNLYHDATRTSVFASDFGAGRIVFLGFDWFDQPTPADWNTVLGSSVDHAASGAIVPEPITLATFGLMGVAGAGYVRRRMKAVPTA